MKYRPQDLHNKDLFRISVEVIQLSAVQGQERKILKMMNLLCISFMSSSSLWILTEHAHKEVLSHGVAEENISV